IKNDQYVCEQNGNERRERGAGDAESWPRADSKNQKRRQHHVENDAGHLENHRSLNDSGRAQRRTHRDERKLQHKRGNEPEKITLRERSRDRISAQRVAIPTQWSPSANARRSSEQD